MHAWDEITIKTTRGERLVLPPTPPHPKNTTNPQFLLWCSRNVASMHVTSSGEMVTGYKEDI